MTPMERDEMRTTVRLELREYFDHYLQEVFPQQVAEMFKAHNQDIDSHKSVLDDREESHLDTCPTRIRFDRMKWLLIGGVTLGGSFGAFGLGKLAAFLGKFVSL